MADRNGGGPAASGGGDRASLGDFVRQELRHAIQQGRYRPGDRVRESELVAWLGVSRTPVREAMDHLSAEGLLMADPRGGHLVAQLNARQVEEFYEVRAALEAQAARSAAQHISPFEIEILEDNLRQCHESRGSVERLLALDEAFHLTIYDAAHNRYLRQTLANLRSVLGLLRGTVYQIDDRRRAGLAEHGQILEALKRGDREAAFEAAARHMTAVKEARLQMIQEAAP